MITSDAVDPEPTEEWLDNNQLSRLGINTDIMPDTVHPVITGVDLAASMTADQALSMTDGTIGAASFSTEFHSEEPIILDSPMLEVTSGVNIDGSVETTGDIQSLGNLDVSGYTMLNGHVSAFNGLEVYQSFRVNGRTLDEIIQERIDTFTLPLEDRITELETIIRRLTEDNGQDQS